MKTLISNLTLVYDHDLDKFLIKADPNMQSLDLKSIGTYNIKIGFFEKEQLTNEVCKLIAAFSTSDKWKENF